MQNKYPFVTVCFITYCRLDILTQCVTAFLDRCTYPRDRLELILCDDGSPIQIQNEMRDLPFDKFLFSKSNMGLGHNTNKGIRSASGDFILQLQDDWLLEGKGDFIERSIEAIRNNEDIGMIRFRQPTHGAPMTLRPLPDGGIMRVLENIPNSIEFNAYTDNPHLKSRAFHSKIGFYREKVPMTVMELDFIRRVSRQKDLKVGYIDNYDVFRHIGADHSFNPGVKRAVLKNALLSNPVTKYPFRVCLALKKALNI